MKKLTIAAFGAAIMALTATGAQAFPAAPSAVTPDSQIIQVAQGCGPGWHRGAYGRCVPHRAGPRYMRPGPAYMAPRVMPRRCWMERTWRGPVRVCR